MIYVVVRRNEDGEVTVSTMSQSELEAKLNEDYWGNVTWIGGTAENDPQCWPGDNVGMIVRGEIVKPKAVTEVTKWSVE